MSVAPELLFEEILKARQRVYQIAQPTPLQQLVLEEGEQVYIKREDLSPIYAYKWRGAYNRMRMLSEAERASGVVCASAGNHAQGVALAARRLDTRAVVFMPRSTPRMKQEAVRRIGGETVEVRLQGDSYDEAYAIAAAHAKETGLTLIHPYDDLHVMAGQGTIADEVVMAGVGEFDVAYLQIGGGGMAAGVACWLKRYYPKIEIVGVEGVDQASMQAAVKAGEPVTLRYLDVFCDGTAVKRVGDLTMPLCRQLIDRFVTVSNEEVCASIQLLWENARIIPEPAGAMGLAGWQKECSQMKGKRVLTIVCGANMDFGQLSWIARHAGLGSARRKLYRFYIPERPGSLLHLLETFLEGVNIIEFQHGIVSEREAAPVIGIEAMPPQFDLLEKGLKQSGIRFEDATRDEDVEFRIIHYDAKLIARPYFVIIEFPERAGALHDFLQQTCQEASIVYFNYTYTGERVGRALLGLDFASEAARERFKRALLQEETVLRAAREVSPEAVKRIV